MVSAVVVYLTGTLSNLDYVSLGCALYIYHNYTLSSQCVV